ncbi:MAG: 4Fe-4S binding protein [Candidatus Methanomethylophilaceae archaeon]|nr:4Fe-4S binding protein [Candidatus Methanomethylophilaceae archaeon]
MIGRKVSIDREKCDGCGLCVTACHEGAIQMVDGKAALVRADVCDGLGDCLPACPLGAISFTSGEIGGSPCIMAEPGYQWPIQIGLVSPVSSFFRDTLVIAADCTAFSTDDFRDRFIRGRPVIIGCPKLDDRSRFDKIAAILSENPVNRVEVVRMEVPCCRALVNLVRQAAHGSGRDVEVVETVISRSGAVL